MKKQRLFLFSILLLCLSCLDDRIEMPDEGPDLYIPFGVEDAREFFESNATDLSPLSFSGRVASKGADRVMADLHPRWEEAMVSGHRGVSLIEVPLGSTTVALMREYTMWNGSIIGCRESVCGRRLVVAKRVDGEVEMFVATIVPSGGASKVKCSVWWKISVI